MPASAKKIVLPALAALAALLLSSCGDEISGPGGPPDGVPYQADIVSYRGGFNSICGTGSDDVYAVSDAVFHFDGRKWNALTLPTNRGPFRSAWSPVRGELFLTDGEDLYHFTQGEWSVQDRTTGWVVDVWAAGPNDAYAVGDGIMHYNGIAWRDLDIGPERTTLNAVTGTGPRGVVAVGERGLVLEYDGNAWSSVEIDSTTSYRSVARTPSGRIFVTQWEGDVLEIMDSTAVPVLEDVFEFYPTVRLCADGEDVYAVGRKASAYPNMVISRFSGGEWTDVALVGDEVLDLWRAPGGGLYASDRNGILIDGQRVTPRIDRGPFRAAWGMDGTVFLAGTAAWRVEGGEWTDLGKEYVTGESANAMHGRDTDDIYAVGREMIIHFDGTRWSWVNGGMGEYLQGVWAGPGDDVVAVGASYAVEYDGTAWSRTLLSSQGTINDVWGSGDHVWVVGYDGFVAERSGGMWRASEVPGRPHLTALFGLDATHVYALTDAPRTYYLFDGRTWRAQSTGSVWMVPLRAMWGTSPSNLFCVDNYGTLANFNGRQWGELPRILGDDVEAIWGTPGGGLIIAGTRGTAVYRRR